MRLGVRMGFCVKLKFTPGSVFRAERSAGAPGFVANVPWLRILHSSTARTTGARYYPKQYSTHDTDWGCP